MGRVREISADLVEVFVEEVAGPGDEIAEVEEEAVGPASSLEFLVEVVGVLGPVVGGGLWSFEAEVWVGLEGFGDHEDGEALVVLVELQAVGGVCFIAEGEGLVVGVAERLALGVACDFGGRLWGSDVVLVESAVETEREGLEEDGERGAVGERESCRVGAGEVEGGVLVVHGEGGWGEGGWGDGGRKG